MFFFNSFVKGFKNASVFKWQSSLVHSNCLMSFIVRPLPWQPSVLTKAEKKPLGCRSPNFDCIFTQTASLQWWGMSDPPVAETSLSWISRKKPNKLNQPETEPPVLANACPCFHAQLMKTTWQLAGQYRDVPLCSAALTSHHATSFQWLLSRCFTFTITKERNILPF